MVAMQKDEIVDFDIFEALNMKKSIDLDLYKMAHEMCIRDRPKAIPEKSL